MRWRIVGQSKRIVVEPSKYYARGYKLVDFGLPPGSETTDKGKGYQNRMIEIAHHL